MNIFKKIIQACSSSENQRAKTFLIKAGFMEYMTNRWRKNLNGHITIFCHLEEEIEFSANFNVTASDGITKQGSIPPKRMSAQKYEDGLKDIVEEIQRRIL